MQRYDLETVLRQCLITSSLYAVKSRKRKMPGSRGVIWYAYCLHAPYSFQLILVKGEEQERKNDEQKYIFMFGFLHLVKS